MTKTTQAMIKELGFSYSTADKLGKAAEALWLAMATMDSAERRAFGDLDFFGLVKMITTEPGNNKLEWFFDQFCTYCNRPAVAEEEMCENRVFLCQQCLDHAHLVNK